MQKLLLLAVASGFAFSIHAAILSPTIQWQRTFGGNKGDTVFAMLQTPDGGFVVGGDSEYYYENDDFLVIRLDSTGNTLWTRRIGGINGEHLTTLESTGDGGVIIAGESTSPPSTNGLTIGKSSPLLGLPGSADAWVVRLDSNGNKLWDRSFGSANSEHDPILQPLQHGGFILAFGGPSAALVRLDPQGNSLWSTAISVSGNKFQLKEATNGDFLLLDWSKLVRLSTNGVVLWQHPLVPGDWPCAVFETKTNTIIFGTAPSPYASNYFARVTTVDAMGNLLFSRQLLAQEFDLVAAMALPTNGGVIISGIARATPLSDIDYGVARFDASTNRIWTFLAGGNDSEWLRTMIQTCDGGLLLGGSSDSGVSRDKTEPGFGEDDFWVLKIAPDAINAPPRLQIVRSSSPGSVSHTISLTGVSNHLYAVDGSSNLMQWVPVFTNRATTGSIQTNLTIDAGTNYFRARLVP